MFLLLNLFIFSVPSQSIRNSIRKEVFLLAPSVRAQFVTVRKAELWEGEAAGHLVSTAQKAERELKALAEDPSSATRIRAAQFPVTAVTGVPAPFSGLSSYPHACGIFTEIHTHR